MSFLAFPNGNNTDVAPMSRAQPARALDTTFSISPARPALVSYTIQIVNAAAADGGHVDLLSDGSSPPTTLLARVKFGPNTGSTGTFTATLTGLVFAGHNVRLASTVDGGTPAITVPSTMEVVL